MGALLAIVWAKVRAQGKRIDELRDDVKELRPEHKADNRALAGKLDRLVESLLMAMDTDLPSTEPAADAAQVSPWDKVGKSPGQSWRNPFGLIELLEKPCEGSFLVQS